MSVRRRLVHGLLAIGCAVALPAVSAPPGSPGAARASGSLTLRFDGVDYLHRWSKDGQNEFTPKSDPDLSSWKDMLTVNVFEAVRTGEELAEVANKVLGNYQARGKILRTDSKPRTADRPAEHLIVAALGDPAFLEAAFARLLLVDGAGYVVVRSHRVYGKAAGPAMSDWLKANGPGVEKALMEWGPPPSRDALRKLPQAK
ncbi:MAG: hypothetical protein KJ062_03595 [Thermoanaerobaculia bacterium]|nr:hypothetical protein [Thermoanaerobaculia bacterium]